MRAANRYLALLDEIEFHASLRYADYEPFRDSEPDFLLRLADWIGQNADQRYQQTLLEMIPWLTFLDRKEMRSLYRDAFRRIVSPWVVPFQIEAQLSPDWPTQVKKRLAEFRLFSITSSFSHKDFENVNGLNGIPKMAVLGESVSSVRAAVSNMTGVEGIIVLEDVVGSGNQAARVLGCVREVVGAAMPILFVPLVRIHVDDAEDPLAKIPKVHSAAVMTIPMRYCVRRDATEGEPELFRRIRAIVNACEKAVCQRLDELDTVPSSPFGYGEVGALLVTHQNTPNNTLPMIYHKSPTWNPLFRRSEHSYRSKKP